MYVSPIFPIVARTLRCSAAYVADALLLTHQDIKGSAKRQDVCRVLLVEGDVLLLPMMPCREGG